VARHTHPAQPAAGRAHSDGRRAPENQRRTEASVPEPSPSLSDDASVS